MKMAVNSENQFTAEKNLLYKPYFEKELRISNLKRELSITVIRES
jgi:hypothetical protein